MSRTSTLLLAALCSADALSIGSAPTITSRAAGPSRPRAMVPESVLTSRAPAARSCGATRAAAPPAPGHPFAPPSSSSSAAAAAAAVRPLTLPRRCLSRDG